MKPACRVQDLRIARLTPEGAMQLTSLLRAIEAVDASAWFRPHAFDAASVDALCDPARRDLHYVLSDGEASYGYGLLRGWDEGFETPSLGIAVHPEWRNVGFATTLMQFLHCAARLRGAARVRLRVHAGNTPAIGLYRRLGYVFDEGDGSGAADRLRVAFKDLNS